LHVNIWRRRRSHHEVIAFQSSVLHWHIKASFNLPLHSISICAFLSLRDLLTRITRSISQTYSGTQSRMHVSLSGCLLLTRMGYCWLDFDCVVLFFYYVHHAVFVFFESLVLRIAWFARVTALFKVIGIAFDLYCEFLVISLQRSIFHLHTADIVIIGFIILLLVFQTIKVNQIFFFLFLLFFIFFLSILHLLFLLLLSLSASKCLSSLSVYQLLSDDIIMLWHYYVFLLKQECFILLTAIRFTFVATTKVAIQVRHWGVTTLVTETDVWNWRTH